MLTQDLFDKFKNKYDANPANKAVEHAVKKVGVNEASYNSDVVRRHNFVFSDETKMGKITNQKSTGRCWMFATLNSARLSTMEKLNVEDFQYSTSYTLFFDKIEKANFFLNNIIETADLDYNSRTVWNLLASPCEDGGYWQYAVGILNKYGNVPQSVMPETYNSEDTDEMNFVINSKLREAALVLRKMIKNGASDEEIQAKKEDYLYFVYNVLVKALGEVPTRFDYSYKDKDGNFHKIEDITPKEFIEKYVDYDLNDTVNLYNCPIEEYPFGKAYELKYCASVQEAEGVKFVNAPIEVLKESAIKAIKAGVPMWFACDVSTISDRKGGYLDTDVYAFSDVFGEELHMNKAERTMYGAAECNHAMALVGVDLDKNGKPLTWKVENSWGDENGDEGVFSMTDEWFEEYLYHLIVPTKFVDEKWVEISKEDPIPIEPWEPLR